MDPIYYLDHAQRYPDLSEDERKEYPDEIKLPGRSPIKRERSFADLTKEEWDRYGPYLIHIAAKDIRFSQLSSYR